MLSSLTMLLLAHLISLSSNGDGSRAMLASASADSPRGTMGLTAIPLPSQAIEACESLEEEDQNSASPIPSVFSRDLGHWSPILPRNKATGLEPTSRSRVLRC